LADLDSNKLHDFLSAKARKGVPVTEQEVATHFRVELTAVKKCFGLLTGHCVLEEKEQGQYDCSNVLRLSKQAFDSARSQGKGNQEYVRWLFREIEKLNRNNDTMRQRLEAANNKLRDLGIDPKTLF
jgi:hypothetical protein